MTPRVFGPETGRQFRRRAETQIERKKKKNTEQQRIEFSLQSFFSPDTIGRTKQTRTRKTALIRDAKEEKKRRRKRRGKNQEKEQQH